MKIIYHCYGGSHSSVTAAGIHLGLLPENRLPTMEELMNLRYFDKTEDSDFGLIRLMGVDDGGNEVYVLGKKSMGEKFNRTLQGMARIIGVDSDLVVINTMPCVNWLMMAGGYLSRRMGILSIGRPLVVYGTKKAYSHLVNVVRECKSKMSNKPGPISFPKNMNRISVVILGTTPFHHVQEAARLLLTRARVSEPELACRGTGGAHDGLPVFIGRDHEGNRVYTIGLGREMQTGAKALACLVSMFALHSRPVLISSVRIKGETWVRMAAALAGWPGGSWLGGLVLRFVVKPQRKNIEEQTRAIAKALDAAKRWLETGLSTVSSPVT